MDDNEKQKFNKFFAISKNVNRRIKILVFIGEQLRNNAKKKGLEIQNRILDYHITPDLINSIKKQFNNYPEKTFEFLKHGDFVTLNLANKNLKYIMISSQKNEFICSNSFFYENDKLVSGNYDERPRDENGITTNKGRLIWYKFDSNQKIKELYIYEDSSTYSIFFKRNNEIDYEKSSIEINDTKKELIATSVLKNIKDKYENLKNR